LLFVDSVTRLSPPGNHSHDITDVHYVIVIYISLWREVVLVPPVSHRLNVFHIHNLNFRDAEENNRPNVILSGVCGAKNLPQLRGDSSLRSDLS